MEQMHVTLGVKVAVLYKDEVLLVKHSYQDSWGIPGGMIENGEHPVHAGKREIREELGIDLDDTELSLFGVYLNKRKERYDYVFLYTMQVSHKPSIFVDNVEITEARWWNRGDFSSSQIGHRTRNRLLEICGEKPIVDLW